MNPSLENVAAPALKKKKRKGEGLLKNMSKKEKRMSRKELTDRAAAVKVADPY